MDITDEDIQFLLYDDNVQEFLDAVVYQQDYKCYEEYKTTKEVVINFVLFLFYSTQTKKKDWVQDIVYVFDNDIFNKNYLAPCLQNKDITNLLLDIKTKISTIKNTGAIEVYNSYVSYDLFNQYMNDLYKWCIETFSTS